MDKSPLRMILVDGQAIMREGLNALLSPIPEFNIVGEAQDGWQAIRMAQTHSPDLVITDLLLPKMNGIDAITEIVSRKIKTSILVLTADDSEACVREAFSAGAVGYILKSCTLMELAQAIRSVSNGNSYLSPAISSKVINGYVKTTQAQRPTAKWCGLTKRERQILQLIGEGSRNRDVAAQLHISIKTVEKHRSNLRSKLNIHTTHGLIRYWELHGLHPASYQSNQRRTHSKDTQEVSNLESSFTANWRMSDAANESSDSW